MPLTYGLPSAYLIPWHRGHTPHNQVSMILKYAQHSYSSLTLLVPILHPEMLLITLSPILLSLPAQLKGAPSWEVLLDHLNWKQLLPQCSRNFLASIIALTLSGLLLLSEMLSLLRVGTVSVLFTAISPGPSTVPSTWEVLNQYLLNEWICKLGLCCIQSIWMECFPLHFQSASLSWGSNSSTIYCQNPSPISNI